jgi:hypothetical protein
MAFSLADSTIYENGKSLDTVTHNRNLYDFFNPKDNGVYSKLNGEINASDFRLTESSEKFERAQIWPGKHVIAGSESSITPLEFFSTASPVGSPSGNESWSPIPGASIKFYQPHECRVGLIDFSAYVSPWKPFYVDDNIYFGDGPEPTETFDNADIMYHWSFWTRVVLDGQPYSSTYTRLPLTAFISPHERLAGGVICEGSVFQHEYQHGCQWSNHLLKRDMSKGWHNAQMEFRMSVGGCSAYIDLKRGNKRIAQVARNFQRLFTGIRNVRVLSLT